MERSEPVPNHVGVALLPCITPPTDIIFISLLLAETTILTVAMEQRRRKNPWLPLLLVSLVVFLLSVAFSGADAGAHAPADASNGEGKCHLVPCC